MTGSSALAGGEGRRAGRVAGAEVFVVWALAMRVERSRAEDMEDCKAGLSFSSTFDCCEDRPLETKKCSRKVGDKA